MKTRKNAISLAIGATALAGSLAAAATITTGSNPFGFTDLDNGYMVAGHDGTKGKDGSCGESKCGDSKPAKKVKKDGSCGESKCGDDKAKAKKVSKTKKDGSCGESKCGDNQK